MPKTPSFYSEFGEDKWIFENLPWLFSSPGVFIDVGARHPTESSNTEFLREIGWPGIAIDADPSCAGIFEGVCPFFCAVLSDKRRSLKFEVRDPPGHSRISDKGRVVTAIPLGVVMDVAGITSAKILSVDVEGHEFEVLKGYPWRGHDWPRCIITEFNTAGIGEDERGRQFLESLGYRLVHKTVANEILVLE